MVLKFKRARNEAKMVIHVQTIKNEFLNDFKNQPGQEWSYMLFSRSNESRMKLKLFSCTYVYRMNLLRALKCKWVNNEAISGFEY